MFDKIVIYQYGKVGSTSLRENLDGKYYPFIQNNYGHVIQTHSNNVMNDLLSKYKNMLIINIVRLPTDRNLSDFWQNINKNCPDWEKIEINKICQKFNNSNAVKYCNNWMTKLFNSLDINIDEFKFNHHKKFVEIKKNTNTILFFRFEDLDYLEKHIYPIYKLKSFKKFNVASKKCYALKYKQHKNIYRLSDEEKEVIINDKLVNLFYTKKEIKEHILKWSK